MREFFFTKNPNLKKTPKNKLYFFWQAEGGGGGGGRGG